MTDRVPGEDGRSTESASRRLAGVDGENVVVSGPPMAGKSAFVADVLAAASRDDRDGLLVTSTRSPGRLLSQRPAGDGRIGVVDCTPGETGAAGERVTTVGSPGDLTGLSMPISEFIEGVERPVLALDSLSTLLMYAERSAVFKFLSVLTTQVRANGGLGLFTFDAESHDERALRTFEQLFDGRVALRRDEGDVGVDGLDGVGEP